MRIEASNGNPLTSLDDWEPLHEPKHWKPGRSAHSIADFVMNQGGADKLQLRVSSVLGEAVDFHTLTPECEIRFDRYGRGRVHDLGIRGKTASGKSLFVGVEAKVDETFNEYVRDAWQKANEVVERGRNSNKPQRIRELCARFKGGPGISVDSDISYQLLYGTAGTVDAGADVSVFYVAVFITDAYDASTGEANHQDYLRFIERAGGEPISVGEREVSAHRLILGKRELVSIYEYFDMR